MLTIRRARTALRQFVFGPPIPQFCTVGLKYPQSEVRVWLRGLGTPLDVTDTNVIVAARPFTVGIGLERIPDAATIERAHLFMSFSDQFGDNRLLGEIRLSYAETIRIGDREQMLAQKRGLEALPGFCPSATSCSQGSDPARNTDDYS
jgi:hypothetical protein